MGFVGATVVATLAKYLTVYRQRENVKELQHDEFLTRHLELMIGDYKQKYDPTHDIRVNVMLPQSKRELSYEGGGFDYTHEQYLQIAHCAGGGIDSDIREHDCGEQDETTTPWGVDQPAEGNCGRAFVAGEVRVAGRVPAEDRWPGQETTHGQDRDTRAVNSVLSVPIRNSEAGEPIAVLNVDAPAPLRETSFESDEVQRTVAERYASRLATVV
ncbi:hypothetical protein [Halobaculum sp. MBLA0143]|uniref:hypothetical protein n=1 Tax=Halobaculum sp. MBLA0143 TaxID=3079933 RepID=UPI0035262F85